MATFHRALGAPELDGQHCDLGVARLPDAPEVQTCLHFFPGLGFRPAVWVMQRDQYGDKPIRIVGDDSPFLAKYDGPIELDPVAAILAELPQSGILAALTPQPTGTTAWAAPSGPAGAFPVFSGGGSSGGGSSGGGSSAGGSSGSGGPGGGTAGGDSFTDVPSGGSTTTPPDVTYVPPSPVPLSGSGLFLIAALALLLGKTLLRPARGASHGTVSAAR